MVTGHPLNTDSWILQIVPFSLMGKSPYIFSKINPLNTDTRLYEHFGVSTWCSYLIVFHYTVPVNLTWYFLPSTTIPLFFSFLFCSFRFEISCVSCSLQKLQKKKTKIKKSFGVKNTHWSLNRHILTLTLYTCTHT